jgi:hypothetical protein
MFWTGVVFVGTLLIIAVIVLAIYRRRKTSENSAEIDERLQRRLEELRADHDDPDAKKGTGN